MMCAHTFNKKSWKLCHADVAHFSYHICWAVKVSIADVVDEQGLLACCFKQDVTKGFMCLAKSIPFQPCGRILMMFIHIYYVNSPFHGHVVDYDVYRSRLTLFIYLIISINKKHLFIIYLFIIYLVLLVCKFVFVKVEIK